MIWPDFDGMDWTYPKELVPFSSVGVNPIKSIGVTYVECFACVHRFFRLGQCFLIVMPVSFSQFFFVVVAVFGFPYAVELEG